MIDLTQANNFSRVVADTREGNERRREYMQTVTNSAMRTHDERNYWNENRVPYGMNRPEKILISAYRTDMNRQRNLNTVFNDAELASFGNNVQFKVAGGTTQEHSNLFMNRNNLAPTVLLYENAKHPHQNAVTMNVSGVPLFTGHNPPMVSLAPAITRIDPRHGNTRA